MAQLPAYAVNEGKVPAEMLRRALWASTRGESGVVTARDLKVTALPTPGPQVRVAAGGAICAMRTTGANAQEAYMLAQDSTINVPIADTGTFYLIARIDDWHFTGNPAPVDKANALYWGFATVATLDGITYPYVPLARIERGSNTNITNAMITDLRKVANPRREVRVLAEPYGGAQKDIGYQTGYEDVETAFIDIPEWATHAEISATFSGIALRTGSAIGWASPSLAGQAVGLQTRVDENFSGDWHRFTVVGGGPITIPEASRGTQALFRWRMKQDSGAGRFRVDSGSTFLAVIEFVEKAV